MHNRAALSCISNNSFLEQIMDAYPENYWHCAIRVVGAKTQTVANDLLFSDLQRQIVEPWLHSRSFTVAGTIVRSSDQVEEIRIAHTGQAQQVYADRHNAEMRAQHIGDGVTDRRMLPIWQGKDYTFEFLFSGTSDPTPDADAALVERLCRRIAFSARILSNRQRKGKFSYVVEDEYDVQDLLHSVLRAYLKYSVQEEPLQKVAGTRAGRADMSIEDLGVLIEVKYVRGPDDQRKIFDDFSQDLLLYAAWSPLKTLLFIIYNSSDLRDPESLERLSGTKEISGKRFNTVIVLA
jgi:hypothetical protein